MAGRPKRGSGERSNWYSRSKFTNWTPFDPYRSEAKAFRPASRPVATVPGPGSESVPIFSRKVHSDFIGPVTPGDVRDVLSACPVEFLAGLERVCLLGGSSKQARAIGMFRYGTYGLRSIFLHPCPKSMLTQVASRPPAPHERREFERFGARIEEVGGRWLLRFDASSLRRFYLFDVLLHELGHHVDARVFERPNRAAERYAEWFASEQSRRLSE